MDHSARRDRPVSGGASCRGLTTVVWLGAMFTIGCAPDTNVAADGPVDRAALLAVSLPDLARLEESVQAQRHRNDPFTVPVADTELPNAVQTMRL